MLDSGRSDDCPGLWGGMDQLGSETLVAPAFQTFEKMSSERDDEALHAAPAHVRAPSEHLMREIVTFSASNELRAVTPPASDAMLSIRRRVIARCAAAAEIVSTEVAYVTALCVLHDAFVRRLQAACALEIPILQADEIEVRSFSVDMFFSVRVSCQALS